MASALASLENATLTLAVPTSGTVTDAETGNVTAATVNVTVGAFLKGAEGDVERYPGVDVADVELSGYAVKPQVLDARVVAGTLGTMAWDGGTWDVEVLGVREKYGATGLIGATLRSAVGDAVRVRATRQR